MTDALPRGAELARQLRRAQAVARLRHPNLVRMLPLPGGAGLSPALANARRLADFTLPRGTFKRFDLEQVVRLLLDVLSGLAALHEVVSDDQAFVHGQVSPQHIYIDEHGIARLLPLVNQATVDAGYAAPERMLGTTFDARADVFSVGVMLWEALAGKRLFPNGVAARDVDTVPAPSLAPNARWAAPLCAMAQRAVALDPAARFASAIEFSNALAAAAAQRLATVDTDAWPDEAPTPVFQPRLHLTPPRSTTPPPAVLTLTTEPIAVGGGAAAGALPRQSNEARGPSRGLRVVALAVGVALASAGFLLGRAPGLSSDRSVPASSPGTAAVVSAVVPAVSVAASSAPTPSASIPVPRLTAAPARPKPRVTLRARGNDYGI